MDSEFGQPRARSTTRGENFFGRCLAGACNTYPDLTPAVAMRTYSELTLEERVEIQQRLESGAAHECRADAVASGARTSLRRLWLPRRLPEKGV